MSCPELCPALAEPGPRKKGSSFDFCAFLRRLGISKGNDFCNLCHASFSQKKKIQIILEALTLEIRINNLKMLKNHFDFFLIKMRPLMMYLQIFFFSIERQLLYSVVEVSAVHEGESVMIMYVSSHPSQSS